VNTERNGFQVQKLQVLKEILIERENTVNWRYAYLQQIRKCMETSEPILYLYDSPFFYAAETALLLTAILLTFSHAQPRGQVYIHGMYLHPSTYLALYVYILAGIWSTVHIFSIFFIRFSVANREARNTK
jgi:hypothetical protein